MAHLLDGTRMAADVKRELQPQVRAFSHLAGRPPGLAAVLVGEAPASQRYVRNKRRACAEVGMQSWLHEFPARISQGELLEFIHQLNRTEEVDGILVQLPLPAQIANQAVIEAVSVEKDVDCFCPLNMGLLVTGQPRFIPCTPHAVWQILQRGGIDLDGKHVVILGRSNLVGKPLSLLLMQKHPNANATVSVCHSRSRQLAELTRQADVLVAAMGQAEFVRGDMVKEGAVVVDVGINRNAEGKLVGDVQYDAVSRHASAITPVPGGVGPMTIAMLLVNTLSAAQARRM